jgi:hypothetical protein
MIGSFWDWALGITAYFLFFTFHWRYLVGISLPEGEGLIAYAKHLYNPKHHWIAGHLQL